jgi:hypothetical protein
MKSMERVPEISTHQVYNPEQREHYTKKLTVYNEYGDVTYLDVDNGSINIGFYKDTLLTWKVTEYIRVYYRADSQTIIDISYKDGNKEIIRSISKKYFRKLIGFLDDQVNAHKLFYTEVEESYVEYKPVMTWEEVESLPRNKYVVWPH